MKYPNLYRNIMYIHFKNVFFLGINEMFITAQKVMSLIPLPHGAANGGQLQKIFPRNCIKYLDLCRKIIHGIPSP